MPGQITIVIFFYYYCNAEKVWNMLVRIFTIVIFFIVMLEKFNV